MCRSTRITTSCTRPTRKKKTESRRLRQRRQQQVAGSVAGSRPAGCERTALPKRKAESFGNAGSNRSQVAWQGHALRVARGRRCQNEDMSLFALSLTRFAFRNPNGITYGYATFDLLLQNLSITKKVIDSFCFSQQNSSITKRCFVILSASEESRKHIINHN